MLDKQEMAILFSGGTDSLALYGLAAAGNLEDLKKPRRIHLLHMLNGLSRFHDFPQARFQVAKDILAKRVPKPADLPEALYVELDMGRLFQGLWLDHYEELMPRFNGKNLVCVACKLAMHTRALLYSMEHLVPSIATGYSSKQDYYPEQTPVFMEKIAEFTGHFGVKSTFPVYEAFDDKTITRHTLEDLGLPSTGGGERKCLFSQTLTTATAKEIGQYMDEMIPRLTEFVDLKLAGRVKEAARCFPPGNTHGLK
ncbi:MAG: hypothetical protein KKE17_13945 [Proteobacteria bacterium]|nr:hypothetical protein [Pseudomonadota bacterium]MBU1711101.1 hypothetical protein [Pseudomonadota bacterium]